MEENSPESKLAEGKQGSQEAPPPNAETFPTSEEEVETSEMLQTINDLIESGEWPLVEEYSKSLVEEGILTKKAAAIFTARAMTTHINQALHLIEEIENQGEELYKLEDPDPQRTTMIESMKQELREIDTIRTQYLLEAFPGTERFEKLLEKMREKTEET